jgi:nucleotide-binding universal stress UspA family protein
MHVLVPTDGSDLARDAATRGFALLSAPTKVTVLTIVGDLPADTGGGIEGPILTPEQADDLQKSEEHQAHESITAIRGALTSAIGAATVDERIEMGDPAAMIVSVARELGVDLIIVGSHGKGFLSRVLLGSVSEHVTRHAPCPVLVVRPADSAD